MPLCPPLDNGNKALCLRPRLEPSLRGLQDFRRTLERSAALTACVANSYPFLASVKLQGSLYMSR